MSDHRFVTTSSFDAGMQALKRMCVFLLGFKMSFLREGCQ